MVYTLLQLAIFAAIVISRENDLDHSLTRSLTLFPCLLYGNVT